MPTAAGVGIEKNATLVGLQLDKIMVQNALSWPGKPEDFFASPPPTLYEGALHIQAEFAEFSPR